MKAIKFSVVIPVFNEAANLSVLHMRLTKVMKALKQTYEIIFVDDGSIDHSFQILDNIHQKDKKVRVIRFTRNFGQHPATLAGFNTTKGEIIITLDADLQNPPEEIPKLLGKIDEGYEVVLAMPLGRKHSFYRRIGSDFAKWTLSRLIPIAVTERSAFAAMKSYVIKQLMSYNEKSIWIDGLLSLMGYKIGIVEVSHDNRYGGKTKYNFIELVALWFDLVISFTDIPIRISIVGGLFLGMVGVALAIFYTFLHFAQGIGVSGFATTVILITFFAGVQLFVLGILGEYIAIMNKKVNNRPEYIIREKIGW